MHASRAQLFRSTPRNITRLARAIQRGELVAVPTETVYGLAADALNARACRAIFRAKGRPGNDPLIVHIHRWAQLEELAELNDAAATLAERFWPGPLTLVLPKKPCVPDIVTSGRPSVAIRRPSHPVFRRLLAACDRPLAAPSANPFGYLSPTRAEHVLDSLGSKIHYVLDGGPCRIGLESTIVDLRDARKPVLLRPGAIARAELEEALGRAVSGGAGRTVGRTAAALAPGMLTKHYSPRTPVLLHERMDPTQLSQIPSDEAWLLIRPAGPERKPRNQFALSTRGDLREAGRRLFDVLRQLDRGNWKRIHVELAPGDSALAVAINDRLTRAAAKRSAA